VGNKNCVDGISNVFLGFRTGNSITNSSGLVLLGSEAGRYIADGTTSTTALDNSIFIGQFTKPLANSQTNQIVIGYQSTGLGSNTTVLGNSSTTTTAIYGNLSLGSTVDAGYKLDVTGTARVSGVTTFSSNVGIGTSSPAFALEVSSGYFWYTLAILIEPDEEVTL
jgi:hypothetical protein